jgi:catechol 2,3-dioxygenase-like lactoylglutathione lyase family enzyme
MSARAAGGSRPTTARRAGHCRRRGLEARRRPAQIRTMLRIGSIVWGVRDVPRAIRFWSEALAYRPLREPSADWAILVPREGAGVQLAITQVSSDAETHQRHHLDLYVEDAHAEIERLIGLGARRVDWRYPEGADYVVLADPDGNKFCVIEKP